MAENVWFTKTTATNSNFVPSSLVNIYPIKSDGFKEDSITLPPLCVLPSYYSVQPRSSVNNQPITNPIIVDFNISTPDYLTSVYARITLTNTTGTAINLKSYLLFNRLEILDSNNNILTTIYENNFIDKFIYLDQLKINRIAPAEAFNPVNFGSTVIPANSSVTVNISVPGLISQNSLKTSLINSGLYLKFYMHSRAIDVPASCNVTNFTLTVFGARYFSKQSAYDTQQKITEDLKYRYLQPVRALLTTLNLTAGAQYNLQLVSGSGASALLVLKITGAVPTFANALTYYPVANMEFHDRNNQIVGINLLSQEWLTIANKQYPGSILDYNVLNANDYSNYYLIPFNVSPQLSNSGSVSGLYNLTGFESIVFTMPPTFTSGTYNVEVMSYNYAVAEINKGAITGFVSE